MRFHNAFLAFLPFVVLVLASCGGRGGSSFTYNPIPGVSQDVNDLGRMIAQEQRNIVAPGFSAGDQSAFNANNRLHGIVQKVTGSQTFKKGVAAIKALPAETQIIVFTAYRKPIDDQLTETVQIGEAGEAVEREISTNLTSWVIAAL